MKVHTKSWILMRILLNRFHVKTAKDFLHLMPQEDAQQIMSQDVATSEIDPLFVKPDEYLKNIHFSWVVPYVQKLAPHIQEILVSALPQPLAAGIKKHLKVETKSIKMPKRAAEYFVKQLYDEIKNPEILDPAFLPKQNLSGLLDLTRQELVEVIDFLGLYDLADEVRHIVEKKTLQSIYSCFDTKKVQYIRICMSSKSKFVVSKMNLQNWNGDCSSLKHSLHQRGLYRLAKALCGSHPHFFWHLIHKLDTGRGAVLEKYYKEQSSPGLTTGLIQQVVSVMNFLKQKSGT
jgi:hypothetical protein